MVASKTVMVPDCCGVQTQLHRAVYRHGHLAVGTALCVSHSVCTSLLFLWRLQIVTFCVSILQTRFQIDVSYNYRNINLVEQEQAVLQRIWKQCCAASVNATTRAIVNEGDGKTSGSRLREDRQEQREKNQEQRTNNIKPSEFRGERTTACWPVTAGILGAALHQRHHARHRH